MFQPCVLAVAMRKWMMAASHALLGAEAAGEFLLDLQHAAIGFGPVVGEGDGRVCQEAQHVVFAASSASGFTHTADCRADAVASHTPASSKLCTFPFGIV
jgi:hypothetical protein